MKMKKTMAIVMMTSALVATAAAQQAAKPAPVALREGESMTVHEGESVTFMDAPMPQREKAGFWSVGDADARVPLRTNYEVFHDKTWLTTQAVWLGAIVYDVEVTHAGVAHHRCAEGNEDLAAHPSRGELYRSNIPEYAVGTAFNWLMLKYMTKPLIFVFSGYDTIKHLRGGTGWLQDCW